MSDQTPQRGDERADFDGAQDVQLDPSIERELRAMSAWDGETPKPSLAARALAEHDEEMREARARRSWTRAWTRQGGLLAAAVAIAGLGLSIGLVNANKPTSRMSWTMASRIDAFGRLNDADRDGVDEERARMGKIAVAPGDAAGSQQQFDQMQGQVRQLKVAEPASRVAATVPEQAQVPASTAAPVSAPPAAPAGASAEPKPAETGTRGAPAAELATGAAGQGSEAAKKSEPSDTKVEVGGKVDRASGRESANKDAGANTNNMAEVDGVTNIRRFGAVDGPAGEGAPAAARPTGGMGGMRGEMVQPGAADWAAYVGRSMLLGMPWILLGIALVAIAWIRMRR